MMLMAEKPKEAIGPFKKASLEKEIFISIAHLEHNKGTSINIFLTEIPIVSV